LATIALAAKRLSNSAANNNT